MLSSSWVNKFSSNYHTSFPFIEWWKKHKNMQFGLDFANWARTKYGTEPSLNYKCFERKLNSPNCDYIDKDYRKYFMESLRSPVSDLPVADDPNVDLCERIRSDHEVTKHQTLTN